MSACIHRFALLVLCATSLCAQTRPFPSTVSNVHVFNDQIGMNMTPALWQFAATHYVGTQKMIADHVALLRAHNPGFIVLGYKLGIGAGDIANVFGNQWVSDWNLVTPHPAWFVTTSANQRLEQNDYHWYIMDPSGLISGAAGNGWKEYWVSRTRQEMQSTGSDGIFADSYDLSLINSGAGFLTPADPRFNGPAVLQPAPTGIDWGRHLDIFGSYVKNQFHNGTDNYYFIPNLGGMITTWDTITYWRHADGAMVEGFAHWGTPYDVGDWQLQMNRILTMTGLGRILILQSYPYDGSSFDTDDDDRSFIVANHLLIKGAHTYLGMIDHGLEVEWYPEYEFQLGPYAAPPPASISGLYDPVAQVYVREYQMGRVLVNPQGTPRTVVLGAEFVRLVGTGGGVVSPAGVPQGSWSVTAPLTSITVPAYGGVVLRSAAVPVELACFDAVRMGTGVELTWSTETETSNDGFIIERASGMECFTSIGSVEGHGTSMVRHHYHFHDEAPPASAPLRYRLVQQDLDGCRHLSPERDVPMLDAAAGWSMTVIGQGRGGVPPRVRIQPPRGLGGAEATVSLWDVLGRCEGVVHHGPVAAEGLEIGLPLHHAAAGMHLVLLHTADGLLCVRCMPEK